MFHVEQAARRAPDPDAAVRGFRKTAHPKLPGKVRSERPKRRIGPRPFHAAFTGHLVPRGTSQGQLPSVLGVGAGVLNGEWSGGLSTHRSRGTSFHVERSRSSSFRALEDGGGERNGGQGGLPELRSLGLSFHVEQLEGRSLRSLGEGAEFGGREARARPRLQVLPLIPGGAAKRRSLRQPALRGFARSPPLEERRRAPRRHFRIPSDPPQPRFLAPLFHVEQGCPKDAVPVPRRPFEPPFRWTPGTPPKPLSPACSSSPSRLGRWSRRGIV